MLIDAEIIDSYSRKQALKDGLLIDISEMAQEAGILYPVAITSNLWAHHIANGDIYGRLWDILWIFRIKAIHQDSDLITLNVSFTTEDGDDKLVKLMATCSPGDSMEPVITIMLPEDY